MAPVKPLLMTSKKGKLLVIPCTLGDTDVSSVLPNDALDQIHSCTTFIVENIRSARRFLIKTGLPTKIDDLHFHTLNKHTKTEELNDMLNNALEGQNVGLISEAGCPGVADPGADIVCLAHQKKITVVPLVGPSSILLALMASGLNGQNFAFHGYLPKHPNDRSVKIKFLEQLSKKNNQTQLFIETPYRNNHLIDDFHRHCHPNTVIVLATNLTTSEEVIRRTTAHELNKLKLDINKKPTVFLMHRY